MIHSVGSTLIALPKIGETALDHLDVVETLLAFLPLVVSNGQWLEVEERRHI